MATRNQATTEPDAGQRVVEKIDNIVHRYGMMRGSAIPILQSIQEEFGYIPVNLLPRVSALSGISTSKLYSIITFYAQFRRQPVGENFIQVCHGTACHLAGAEENTNAIYRALHIEEGDTSPDGKYTVEKVACLGCCSLAPVMNINGETFGRLTPEKAVRLVKEVKNRNEGRKEEETGEKMAAGSGHGRRTGHDG